MLAPDGINLGQAVGCVILVLSGAISHLAHDSPVHSSMENRKTTLPEPVNKGNWQRFMEFVEQPLFLIVIGIIGGIAGVLVYTPVFLVCDVCALLALHRSRAVADKQPGMQIFWYALLFTVMTVMLIAVGVAVRKSGRMFIHDLAAAVAEVTKSVVVQPPAPSNDRSMQTSFPQVKQVRTRLEITRVYFPEQKDEHGQLMSDQNLRVGAPLCFNVEFRAIGPNPVEGRALVQMVYLEPDSEPATEKRMLAEFKKQTHDAKLPPRAYAKTIMPNRISFTSACAWNNLHSVRTITQDDLNALYSGTKLAYVIVEGLYEDNEQRHHARTCGFWQRPAQAPGIFHSCYGFGNSD